jgi:muconolactone delta-isomerase
MKYLVVGTGGPGFASPDEAMMVLEEVVLPSFDMFIQLEKKKKITAGGLPVGDRAFVFIVEADSHDELDNMLRNIPMWGTLDWEVTPLQTFSARAQKERQAVKEYKKTITKK